MTTIKLKVKGMSCGHCENSVIKAVTALDGVKSVTASAKKGVAQVTFDETKQTQENITKAVKMQGYEAIG